jgi:putative RecB family exonuclease
MTVDTSPAGVPSPRDAGPRSDADGPGGEGSTERGSQHPLRRHRTSTLSAAELADVRGSLSPSRAADFKTCPLLYRYRTIDRLPEVPSTDQVRGTLVHAVLEKLYELPAAQRTPAAATAMLQPEWQRLAEAEPAMAELFTGDAAADFDGWLASAGELLDGYFTVEDPQRLEPAERESLIEVVLDTGLRLRGFVDRLDVSPAGDIRVVDYKTGGSPREAFEARALFQLKFYALVLWRTRGVVPRSLRLLYLKDREACDYSPDADELARFERNLGALWAAIERATAAKEFPPKRSRLCDWCSHQSRCPEFGGTPPPFPAPAEPGTEPAAAPDTEPAARSDAEPAVAGAADLGGAG